MQMTLQADTSAPRGQPGQQKPTAVCSGDHAEAGERINDVMQAPRFVLQNCSDMPQSKNLQKAGGGTGPSVLLSVALLQIIQLGHVQTLLQYASMNHRQRVHPEMTRLSSVSL